MTHRYAILPVAAVVALLGLAVPAGAQDRDRDRDQDRDRDRAQGYYANNPRALAYDNGYQRGFEHGQNDVRARRSADFRRDRDSRNGDWGYDRRFGDRDDYQRNFRSGYQAGYVDGYEGRASRYGYGVYGQAPPAYGTPYGYGYPTGTSGYAGNVAATNGYNDGYERGLDDARHHRRFNLTGQSWYRDGDRHYDSRYGPRAQYKVDYRDGFRQGYDAGYRDASEGRYRR